VQVTTFLGSEHESVLKQILIVTGPVIRSVFQTTSYQKKLQASETIVGTQLLPGINVVKFPTNAQPSVLRALLNGTIDVAVERPETIQYYNSKVLFLLLSER
jgi:hypothetical protein